MVGASDISVMVGGGGFESDIGEALANRLAAKSFEKREAIDTDNGVKTLQASGTLDL